MTDGCDTPHVCMTNTARQWLAAALSGMAVFLFMWAYHDWWRAKPYSWGTAHECLALAGMFNLSLALLLGPLQRLAGVSRTGLAWRRPLGVTAVVFAAGHVLLTFTVLLGKFNLAYFGEHLTLLAFGAAAIVLLLFLAAISYPWALKRWGVVPWHRFQQLGYVALALVLVHYLVLGTVAKWLTWFEKHDRPMPPGTLFFTAFAALALLAKLADVAVRQVRSKTSAEQAVRAASESVQAP